MDYNINLVNICDTQKTLISPISTTPIRRPLMIENGDKPKNGELTDIVNALDILMRAISNQFTNFRVRLQQINISQIVLTAARELRGTIFRRLYRFYIRFIRGMNVYRENRNIQRPLSNNMVGEVEDNKSIYVGESLNDIYDILSNDLFLYDNSIVHKHQIHPLRFENTIIPFEDKENIIKDKKIEKDMYDFGDEFCVFSGEVEKMPQITQTEAFKKINEMEAQISRLKDDIKRILNLPPSIGDNKNGSGHRNSLPRPCSSLDDGISMTSTQHSPIISPKISEVKGTFLPPPPPPLPSMDMLNNQKNNKLIVNNSKCKKIEENVPTKENDNDCVAKLNSVVLLNEIQNVKLKKVDINEINDRKSKKVSTQSDCNDVGSFLQQALYEKFKNTKLETSSNTDSDSELSLWSDGENDTDTDI